MITGLYALPAACRPNRTIKVLFLALIALVSLNAYPLGNRDNNRALAAGGKLYYLDCKGNDTNNGASPSQAWKSLAKANSAPLAPGDKLLLKRGCTWAGTLKAAWNGTANQLIVISTYGTGNLPKIQNGATDLNDKYHNDVDITGSYQLIEYIETTIVNPPVEPGCNNNPIGFYVGFNFRNPNNLPNGASYNWLRLSKASGLTIGAHLNTNTHHNRIIQNTFTDNHVMNVLTPTSVNSVDDIGAWGILLRGSNQEVAYNYFENNNGFCAYDSPIQGNSVELYEARDNVIHHNISINDADFSELGGSAAIKSDDNTFAYNLVVSSFQYSVFIIARGGKPDVKDGIAWGPTYRTKLYHNTVYYTGSNSQGIVCGAGCSTDILTAKNNIIWANWKAAFADAPFTEDHNIYWSSNGNPLVQFMGFNINPTSIIVNPQFVNPFDNFRLKRTSPAIDAGMNFDWKKDLDNVSVPQGAGQDIGAYEYTTRRLSQLYLPLIDTNP